MNVEDIGIMIDKYMSRSIRIGAGTGETAETTVERAKELWNLSGGWLNEMYNTELIQDNEAPQRTENEP